MLLADHFLIKYARRHNKRIKRIATPAIDMLMSYHWPGNVRELENIVERAVLTCDGQVIHGHDLPPTLQTAEASGTAVQSSLADAIEQFEKDLIVDALKSARGNRAKAARLLGTTERIIGYKIRKYDIEVGAVPRTRRRSLRPGGGPGPAESGVRGLTPSGPMSDATPIGGTLASCDPFAIPSTSHWTGAAIIVR